MDSTMIVMLLPGLLFIVAFPLALIAEELKKQNQKLSVIIEYLHDIKK
jgi:hypothetical protein